MNTISQPQCIGIFLYLKELRQFFISITLIKDSQLICAQLARLIQTLLGYIKLHIETMP
jgi:hypothetical protein